MIAPIRNQNELDVALARVDALMDMNDGEGPGSETDEDIELALGIVRGNRLEPVRYVSSRLQMTNPFRYFKTSPEVIRLAVMMYVRFPLLLRQVEDILHERGVDVSYETVRAWWNRFGPMFATEIRKKRSSSMRALPQWGWHLDEVFVRINGEVHYLWRAVDHEGEVL